MCLVITLTIRLFKILNRFHLVIIKLFELIKMLNKSKPSLTHENNGSVHAQLLLSATVAGITQRGNWYSVTEDQTFLSYTIYNRSM